MPNQEHERERERERERDQTHSYWYIPLAPRVNYSLFVMETIEMMTMASGDDCPSSKVPEQGSRWYFEGIEACGGVVQNLGLFLGVSLFIGFSALDSRQGGPRGSDKLGRRALGGGCTPRLVASS